MSFTNRINARRQHAEEVKLVVNSCGVDDSDAERIRAWMQSLTEPSPVRRMERMVMLDHGPCRPCVNPTLRPRNLIAQKCTVNGANEQGAGVERLRITHRKET